MFSSIFAYLKRFFCLDQNPFKYDPYYDNETMQEALKPIRKRASRKKPTTMAVYKNNKKTITRRKKAA